MEFRNIPLLLLQHIINVDLNTTINLQTLEFWIKIKNKFSRNKEYLKIELIKDKNMIINHNIIGSGMYNYDEQYIKINWKKYYWLTLYDYSNDQPIAEQIIKKEWNRKSLSSKTIEEFIKTATKERPFKALITDGKKQYNEIAKKKQRVQQQNMHIPRNKIHKRRNKKILKIKNTINIRQNDNNKPNITNMPNIQRTKSLWYIQNTKWTKRHRKPTIKTN